MKRLVWLNSRPQVPLPQPADTRPYTGLQRTIWDIRQGLPPQALIRLLLCITFILGPTPTLAGDCCQCRCNDATFISSGQSEGACTEDNCNFWCGFSCGKGGGIVEGFYPGYDAHGCDGGCTEPTLVELVGFTVTGGSGSVRIDWETASEMDNAGFHLWRRDGKTGEYVQITQTLIPAEGSPTQGASYQFIDRNVEPGKTYYYKLEDVDTAGSSTFHGPVCATIPAAIPTMTETGLIVLGVAFLGVTIFLLKRRRKESQYGW